MIGITFNVARLSSTMKGFQRGLGFLLDVSSWTLRGEPITDVEPAQRRRTCPPISECGASTVGPVTRRDPDVTHE